MKAVGPLNDTTRDVCDKTANLYEAAGSYPPWMYDVKPGGAATHGPVLRGIKVC